MDQCRLQYVCVYGQHNIGKYDPRHREGMKLYKMGGAYDMKCFNKYILYKMIPLGITSHTFKLPKQHIKLLYIK